jgi:hypothetical protein
MAKKKTKTWFGITTISEDLKIKTVEVMRETESRIYLAPPEQEKPVSFARSFLNKQSGYERWYPDRKEAVMAKLARLETTLGHKKDDTERLKRLIAEFRKQENL